MQTRKKTGEYGEKVAEKYLNNRGYKTIAKNFHSQGGEIDLIMKNSDNVFVFVEVKTRRNDKFGSPKDAITKKKIEKMLDAIQRFFDLEGFDEWPDFEIDHKDRDGFNNCISNLRDVTHKVNMNNRWNSINGM